MLSNSVSHRIKGGQAFRAGALGYVVKTSRANTFLEGLRSIVQGNFFVDATVANEVMRLLASTEKGPGRGHPGYDALTERERDIMRLIAEGVATVNIAKRLSISPRTVSPPCTASNSPRGDSRP